MFSFELSAIIKAVVKFVKIKAEIMIHLFIDLHQT